MPVYFVGRNGQQLGTYDQAQIQQMLKDAELSPMDLCWTEGMTDWLPIAQVISTGAPIPPPLPPPRPIEPNINSNAQVVIDSRVCISCEKKFSYGWRCKKCQARYCDACVKGGRSTTTGKALRWVAGIYTAGLSEVARSTVRNFKKACPKCGSDDLMRI